MGTSRKQRTNIPNDEQDTRMQHAHDDSDYSPSRTQCTRGASWRARCTVKAARKVHTRTPSEELQLWFARTAMSTSEPVLEAIYDNVHEMCCPCCVNTSAL